MKLERVKWDHLPSNVFQTYTKAGAILGIEKVENRQKQANPLVHIYSSNYHHYCSYHHYHYFYCYCYQNNFIMVYIIIIIIITIIIISMTAKFIILTIEKQIMGNENQN